MARLITVSLPFRDAIAHGAVELLPRWLAVIGKTAVPDSPDLDEDLGDVTPAKIRVGKAVSSLAA